MHGQQQEIRIIVKKKQPQFLLTTRSLLVLFEWCFLVFLIFMKLRMILKGTIYVGISYRNSNELVCTFLLCYGVRHFFTHYSLQNVNVNALKDSPQNDSVVIYPRMCCVVVLVPYLWCCVFRYTDITQCELEWSWRKPLDCVMSEDRTVREP